MFERTECGSSPRHDGLFHEPGNLIVVAFLAPKANRIVRRVVDHRGVALQSPKHPEKTEDDDNSDKHGAEY